MTAETEDSAGADSPKPGDPADLSEFIENMGLHYEAYGVPRIGGRILGLLMLSPRPLAAEDMAESLQVSRSSVSTNLRTLLMTGLVEKVSLPGDRYDYFVFSDTAWLRILEMRLEGILSFKELAEEGLQTLDSSHPARFRLQEMKEWVELVEAAYERLSRKWQSRKEVPV